MSAVLYSTDALDNWIYSVCDYGTVINTVLIIIIIIIIIVVIVYWLSTDIQTPKRKHKHTDSINNVWQGWKGSKRSANNHPNRYSTLETSTSQYVSKQL